MSTVYGLTREEAQELPVTVYIRYVITRSAGLWTSRRVVTIMDLRGGNWSTSPGYRLNFAGNMLGRLEEKGGMIKLQRGEYRAFPEIVHDIQSQCLVRFKNRISPELYSKMLDWSPGQPLEPWAGTSGANH